MRLGCLATYQTFLINEPILYFFGRQYATTTVTPHLRPCAGEHQHLLHARDAFHSLIHDFLEIQSLPASLPLVRRKDPFAVCILPVFVSLCDKYRTLLQRIR